MRRMRLIDIKIPEAFALTSPREEKMCECREFWRYEGKQDRPIVVNHNNVLIDGYVMYLILKEHKEEEADIIVGRYVNKKKCKKKVTYKVEPKCCRQPTTYIYGKHLNGKSQKEYVWRVPAKWIDFVENVQIGDVVQCVNRYGVKSVVVSKIEILEKPPYDGVIKKVKSKRITRNGMIIKYE